MDYYRRNDKDLVSESTKAIISTFYGKLSTYSYENNSKNERNFGFLCGLLEGIKIIRKSIGTLYAEDINLDDQEIEHLERMVAIKKETIEADRKSTELANSFRGLLTD